MGILDGKKDEPYIQSPRRKTVRGLGGLLESVKLGGTLCPFRSGEERDRVG
jgi:hypothetical protein